WTYTYDNDNRLTHVEQRATDGGTLETSADYKYDVFGNRIENDVTISGPAAVTRFSYDGANAWADLSVNNQLTTRRLYLDAVDEVVARIGSNGTVAWYLTDRLGSV